MIFSILCPVSCNNKYITKTQIGPTRLGPTEQTQNICITFVPRGPGGFDVGPTLYKCYTNGLCLLRRWADIVQMLYKWFVFAGYGVNI